MKGTEINVEGEDSKRESLSGIDGRELESRGEINIVFERESKKITLTITNLS